MNKNICIVFICNKNYFNQFTNTCNQLITKGKYNGNICLVIGDDLNNDKLLECNLIKDNNILIKHFPDIQFSSTFMEFQKKMKRPSSWIKKIFQYHKLHLFNKFFKKWDYIFYIDCGVHVFSDISPIINEIKENTLLAHSDSFPNYEWKLSGQFDKTKTECFSKLNNKYDLNNDYFQTTIMLYDTNIIRDDTYNNLLNLLIENQEISATNDQCILALYFTIIEPVWEQIKIKNEDTFFYDFLNRNKNNKYIILKRIKYFKD